MNTLFLEPNTRSHLDFLEGESEQRQYLAGNQFSDADIQVITSRFLTRSKHRTFFFLYKGQLCHGNIHAKNRYY
jgi:glutathione S-transferase